MLAERIIFLREDQYSKFYHQRYGIDTLEKQGLSVEFWDCSKIFRPTFQGDRSPLDSDGFSGLRCFEKKDFLLDNIACLTSRDTLIPVISYDIKTWDVLWHIINTKAFLGMLRLGNVPVPKEQSNFQERLKKFIRRPSIAANTFLHKLPLAKLGLRPLDFILQGGAATLLGAIAHLKGESTKILDAHSFDYDRHLLGLRDKEEIAYPEDVVFLDGGGPFHRDQYIFKNAFPCSDDEYFSNLNNLFRLVEQKFRCSVLVASHPRVQYNKRGNPFEGRKIVQGETQKWVRSSNFVLSFASTAVSFAVIYKKPVVFLALNPSKRNVTDPQIKNMAAKLGKSPIYWTGKGNINWDRELVVDHNCYDQYREIYLKKRGTTEKPCWEIFADYLASLPH